MNRLTENIFVRNIAKSLWQPNGRGNVSVMVGAGFSRNAKKKYPAAPDYPLWGDIASALAKDLYINKKSPYDDPLILGEQYVAIMNRTKLDALLLSLIPYDAYEPGELHKQFMALPWADVFTTNYDTLLEDTVSENKINNQHYNVITTIKDIPHVGRISPRIVKLHGTFPNIRPFIFTEEDYRTYPVKFAPFVNMVRESLMENTFIMMGFSGDDPNFKSWIGWVYDQLGENMPQIFMLTLSDGDLVKRSYYERKNIYMIDLNEGIDSYCRDCERYEKGYESFFYALEKLQPLDAKNWPIDVEDGYYARFLRGE